MEPLGTDGLSSRDFLLARRRAYVCMCACLGQKLAKCNYVFVFFVLVEKEIEAEEDSS